MTTTMTTRRRLATPATVNRRLRALGAGMLKHFPPDSTLVVAGEPYPVAALAHVLDVDGRLNRAVECGRLTAAQALAGFLGLTPQLRELLSQCTAAIRAELGDDNPLLLDFGIQPAGGRLPIRNIAMCPAGTNVARGLRPRRRGERR